MSVLDVLNSLQTVISEIEDENWNSVMEAIASDIVSVSTVNVHVNNNPETNIPGVRAITANVNSQDTVERILANALAAYSTSLRLQRSGKDRVPIYRAGLIVFIHDISARTATLVEWRDLGISGNYTKDYKRSVIETYNYCTNAILNFNSYVTDVVNKGESDIIWRQPDSGINIPIITPLPQRA